MAKQFTFNERRAGLLLHPTSLPGRFGSGDIGREALRFIGYAAKAQQGWWQMLPIGPVLGDGGPYSNTSAFAGGAHLIDLEQLRDEDLLTRRDLRLEQPLPSDAVDYPAAIGFRMSRLRRAYGRFVRNGGDKRTAYRTFCRTHRGWLDDYALFAALKRTNGDKPWWRWPKGVRLREPDAIARARRELRDEVGFARFVQYTFDRQWRKLRRAANRAGVGLIGDLPIFVALDSADVWAHRELFQLGHNGKPKVLSGAAPDAFSKTGQRWGHPLYDWKAHRRTRYRWWIARFERLMQQFDGVRIDHFLGFNRCWAVPARAKTARNGKWQRGPGAGFFEAIFDALGDVPIIAEDLGILTPAAEKLRDRFALPGMRVMQCGFVSRNSYHAPHNFPKNSVAYTGTHDNATVRGWFDQLKPSRNSKLSERQRALAYLNATPKTLHWDMIRALLASSADTAVVPMQDVLGLGDEARMNLPGTTGPHNWTWRLQARDLRTADARKLANLVELYARR